MDTGTTRNVLNFGSMKARDNLMYNLSEVNYIRKPKRTAVKSHSAMPERA